MSQENMNPEKGPKGVLRRSLEALEAYREGHPEPMEEVLRRLRGAQMDHACAAKRTAHNDPKCIWGN